MGLPLAAYPIVSTRDAEVAEQILSRELAALRITSIRNRRLFHFEMNGVRLGRTLVGYNRYATDTIVDPGHPDGMFSLAIGAGEVPSVFHLDGEPVVCKGQGAMTSPSKRLVIHRPAGSGAYMIRVASDVIEGRFQEVLELSPRKPVVFGHSVDLASGVGAQAHRVVKHIVSAIQQDPEVLNYPLLRTGFDEMLLNVLLSLPHNYRDALIATDRCPVTPGVVKRAEEFMEAHATEPITISDVVARCGCSRSALFSAFRRYRHYTPMQFLAELRLKSAREALRSPSPIHTVTSIAYACGFSHLGRFSEAYRLRFGETPSETLRKARLPIE